MGAGAATRPGCQFHLGMLAVVFLFVVVLVVLVVLLLLVLWAVVLLPGRAANFIWQCLRPCFCLWFRWWCWWWRCCCAVGGGAATRPGCQFHAVTLAAVLLVVLVCGVLFVLLLLLFCACVLSPGRAAKFMY